MAEPEGPAESEPTMTTGDAPQSCSGSPMRQAASDEPLAPLAEIPGFRLIRRAGSGGRGVVFEAEEIALGRRVAVKLIHKHLRADEKALERFEREAKSLAAVEHPNIVRLYSLGLAGETSFMVMEYVEGESLSDFIARERRVEWRKAVHLLRQVVEALDAAWEKGIIHRDLKPANILVDRNGRVRVVDFGYAKAVVPRAEAGLTQEGFVVGTVHYMSPEQVKERPLDFRSDMYSMGLVLYEMLTGQHAFDGDTPLSILGKHLHEPLPSIRAFRPDVPEALQRLVERMTEKAPESRPASYKDLLLRMDQVIHGTVPLPFCSTSLPQASTVLGDPGGAIEGLGAQAPPAPAAQALVVAEILDRSEPVRALGEAKARALWADHDVRLGELLRRFGGRRIEHSEWVVARFGSMAMAARFALEYQSLLADLSRDQGVALRARIGLHDAPESDGETPKGSPGSEATPAAARGVERSLAAQITGLARGAQTLLTAQTVGHLGEALPQDAEMRSHGYFEFSAEEAPVEVLELGVRGRTPFIPPSDTGTTRRVVRVGDEWRPARQLPHVLPAEKDALVGRERELQELWYRLAGGARLVTVFGTAGTGKTRLAIHYGWTWLAEWPGGVWFCDLSDARGPDAILTAVAGALGVSLGKGDPVTQLGHAIAGRGRCLLILDNFEQVVEHARDTVGRWVERASDASILVTSRERLHLTGEAVLSLEPLSVETEAVELFVLRARAQRQEFVLTDANRPVVKEIVRLLDGLPLAIELAAARARLLSPAQLLDRLRERFKVLAEARGKAARQSTLRAAIDWSWDLLSPWEKGALAQCAAFEGAFTLEAAEAVLDLSPWEEAPQAMDVVQALVDKSLLRTLVPAQDARYPIEDLYFGMYASVREYAAEKLRTDGAIAVGAGRPRMDAAVFSRHGAFFARKGSEEVLAALSRHGGTEKRRTLEMDFDNLIVACRRAASRGDGAVAAAAFRAAWEVLELRGPFGAAVHLGEEVLAGGGLSPSDQAAVLTVQARALRFVARTKEARARLEEALVVARRAGDRRAEGVVLGGIANLHTDQGSIDEAREAFEGALAIHHQAGNRREEASVMGNLAILHRLKGRMEEARLLFNAALAVNREIGNERGEGAVLSNLGNLHYEQGRMGEARAAYEEAIAIYRDMGARREEGAVLGNLALLDYEAGRTEESSASYVAALAIQREMGNRRSEGILLGNLAILHHQQGQMEEARAAYLSALATHRERGDRRNEGIVLGNLAVFHAQEGRLQDARGSLERGEQLLRDVGDKGQLGKLLCDRGEVELLAGSPRSARAALAEAEALAAEIGAGRESELGGLLEKLRKAIAEKEPRSTRP